MNRIFLITRPKHDETTHYLFYWGSEVLKIAEKKGIQVLDLQKKRANKKDLASIIKKKRPLLCFLNGHGGPDFITGHLNEVLIKLGENEKVLESKIVYALSCQSAKKLGAGSVKKGAIAYIGYNEDFVFAFEQGKLARPTEDKTAGLFLKPSNQLIISLLKGHTVESAYKKSQELFMKNIRKLLTSESLDSSDVKYLWWDMRHQVCLGDKRGTF